MPTNTTSVSQLYSSIAPLENRRLLDHPMERELTLRTIRKALAASTPGLVVKKRIADIGGGPGRIAFALADDGHEVDLVDLTPELVRLAEAEQERRRVAGDITSKRLLRSIAVGNALEKDAGVGPEEEGGYDAVLLLGPLYHLVEEEERVTAVRNAVELVKRKGGLAFVAFVSVAAHLRDVVVREPGRMIEMRGFYEEYLSTGRYEKNRLQPDGTTTITTQSFHTSPDDIRAFFATHFADSLELIELRSTEGILGGGLDATLAKSSEEVIQAWADLMFEQYSAEEQYLGCADHLLAVLRRR